MNRVRFFQNGLASAALSAALLAASPAPAEAPVLAAASTTAGPEPTSPETLEIVRKLQAFYNKARTFQAHFDQRYKIKAYDTVKTNQGRVVFEKPGKMSWGYESGNRVVSDGQLLQVYEKDKKQVYRQNMRKSPYPAALAFLGGSGDLNKEFTFKELDSERMKFKGGHVLLGTPIEPTPAYQKLLLYVDASTFQVRRVLLIDAQQNTNRFDFSQVRVNEKVPPKEFLFTPPPGTNVVQP